MSADPRIDLRGTESTQIEPVVDPHLARTAASECPPVNAGAVARGTSMGRYVLLECIGAGGMGVVYAAYDPELDRKVALKLLKSSVGDATSRARLLREAQAMAQLAHPNVITVHDVGTFGEEVFVAMEFVQGVTMTRWLGERVRGWREVLEVFAAVGRGLAAAHEVGLVHRDLKPDNIMIGGDARVRVMDFGLAHAHSFVPADTLPEVATSPRQRALEIDLTDSHALLGTPAYMAPEQWESARTDAWTDQFSYCVSLWEALYGERPFQGKTRLMLQAAVTEGRITSPRTPRAPGWLRHVLERGLATQPARRWPTMAALLAALERGKTRARLRIAGLAVAGVAMLGAGLEGARRWELSRSTAICSAAGQEIESTWNVGTRAALRAAFVASGVNFAETTADKVMPWLDRQAAAWQQARTDACLNTTIHEVWSADTFGRALWCLDERRMELVSLVAEFGRADARTVQQAVPAVASLGSVARCLDVDYLEGQPVALTEGRETIQALRAELSRVRAIGLAGRYSEALTLATETHGRAELLGWRPLVVAARYQEGALLRDTAAYDRAEEAMREVYFEAVRLGLWDVAVDAATVLIVIVGYDLPRQAEGRTWAEHAEADAAHASDPEGLREAGRLTNLGLVQSSAGLYAEAFTLHERAFAMREQALGPDHPAVARSLNNLAIVRASTGETEAARALFARAVAIKERTLGADNPDFAQSLGNLAMATEDSGDAAGAEVLYRRTIAILEGSVGPDDPNVAATSMTLAELLRKKAAYAEARALNERAVAIYEKTFGLDHPDVASALLNLANVHLATGSYDAARTLYERAGGLLEKWMGPTHPELALALNNLAVVHVTTGRPQAALPLVERALIIYGLNEGEQTGESDAHFTLAQALILAKGDRSRALAEIEVARDGYRSIGAGRAAELATLERWVTDNL